MEQGFDMLWGEHRDNDATQRRCANVSHRALVNDSLGDAPVEKSPQGAKATVQCAFANTSVLDMCKPHPDM
jgi:hypothetical protein